VTATSWLTPSSQGGGFSANCWFFGRDVYNKLNPNGSQKIPVGLIQTTWGGTPDQHWSSPEALQQCTVGYNGKNESWLFPKGYTDSVLWNGQVVPLLRTVHSGAIWYQGEANAGLDGRQYNCSFPAMITDWRRKWNENTGEWRAVVVDADVVGFFVVGVYTCCCCPPSSTNTEH
jgi:sialate O-acetylesterase